MLDSVDKMWKEELSGNNLINTGNLPVTVQLDKRGITSVSSFNLIKGI